MPEYKLTYFNVRGRAELIRLLFAAGEIAYEDVRIEWDKWPELKPNTPMGQIPTLEVDGQVICQSMAIARFVAGKAGLLGKTNMDQARADMLLDGGMDVGKLFTDMVMEKDASKKAEKKKEFGEKHLPPFLALYEGFAGDNGHFVGDSLTWSDIGFFNMMDFITAEYPGALDGYCKLNKVIDNVKSNPGVTKWLKERPVTDR
ncbi:hematopoietic prostaglandin D synthase-like [Branchiostoma floridae]|uniref:glutathione transferase n=1 Tax=Branchiostoma floridae TaxID=7739 RepID=A0A9J7HKV2_BRAFL|nr:hematopoietic prostaglandin D synthase-like [Branchiostoma floridae]